MSTPGLRSSANYLLSSRMLLLLSGIALAIYIFLKKVSTFNLSDTTGTLNLLKVYGLNDTLSSFAVSQFLHETNGFTSDLYKFDNNVCGMTFAGQSLAKQSTRYFIDSSGEKVFYANYNNTNESIHDFVTWYTKHRNKIFSLPLIISSLADYVKFLKNQNYFEADETEYLKGCQYFYNLLFNG